MQNVLKILLENMFQVVRIFQSYETPTSRSVEKAVRKKENGFG